MLIRPTGFREYDARWLYPQDIDLDGMRALGLALGTFYWDQLGRRPDVVCGHDFRSYAAQVQQALIEGLVAAGAEVTDIGTCLSPMAYFAQVHMAKTCVAMVTASHNPNGWTGVKMGYRAPLTLQPADMAALRDLTLGQGGTKRPGGSLAQAEVATAYQTDITQNRRLTRKLRVVCATGNGTASLFLPQILTALGAEVIPRHTTPDHSFPHYNPNPEGHEMWADMAAAVAESGADLALGFDGDGDRCGVIDDRGNEISADKMGLLLARHWAPAHPGRTLVVDVKSTGLFAADPVLKAQGLTTDYWKTGHSYMKARVQERDALAGFERSGHYYLNRPLGRGYDCAATVAAEILLLLDANPDRSLSDLAGDLPQTWLTPTLAPFAADDQKYAALDDIATALKAHMAQGGTLGGHAITQASEVNGIRLALNHGGFALVRASSNTPNLVVICESPASEADLRAIFADLDRFVHADARVGDYDQNW